MKKPAKRRTPVKKKITNKPDPKRKVRTLMKKRKDLEIKLMQLQLKHEKVFDRLAEIQDNISAVEGEVKDVIRPMYKEGHERGQFGIYKDETFSVTCSVRYGQDQLKDPDAFFGDFPEFLDSGFVDFKVNTKAVIDHAEDKVEEGDWKESHLDALRKHFEVGKFHTPAVTIKRLGDLDL